jgi:uncharacterized protein YuzE
MKIQYFEDTDTLYIEFRDRGVADTRDLNENTTIDMDAEGNVLASTFEHASRRTDPDTSRWKGLPRSGDPCREPRIEAGSRSRATLPWIRQGPRDRLEAAR